MASVTMRDPSEEALSQEELEDEDVELLSSADTGEGEDEEDLPSPATDGGAAGSSRPGASGSVGYRVLSMPEAEKAQAAALQQVCELLHCTATVARSILIHFRWDPERVMNVYVDKGLAHLCKAVGLPVPGEGTSGAPIGELTCEICCSTVDADSCPTMLCGHVYCADCWTAHLKVGVDEGKARNLRCMAYKCGAPCDEAVVARLLEGTPQGARYKEALATSYVDDNSLACFCPSAPWCGRAVVVTEPVVEPECMCGHMFCFKCKRGPHTPCTCAMWDKWEEKTQGDSETRNWIMANTKPCPKCTKPVEKNGGCNHVTCKCGQSFCWLCGGSTGTAHTYQSIEGHTCGRWKEEMDKKQGDAARSHQRYMHYFERWKAHADSHSKEGQKKEALMKVMNENVMSGLHHDWLLAAVDQLRVARRVLAPSYVFAYFTFGNDMFKDDFDEAQNRRNQQLFEDQQQMLESEVERLSNLTEQCKIRMTSPEAGPLEDQQRVDVINSTVSIERRIIKFFGTAQDILDQLQTCSAQIAPFVRARKSGRPM